MGNMVEGKSSSRWVQDILEQGNTLFSQLVAEAETIKVMGTVDSDVLMRRNELLLKIADHISEVDSTLKHVDILQKQLKKHLKQLQQLQKILSK